MLEGTAGCGGDWLYLSFTVGGPQALSQTLSPLDLMLLTTPSTIILRDSCCRHTEDEEQACWVPEPVHLLYHPMHLLAHELPQARLVGSRSEWKKAPCPWPL